MFNILGYQPERERFYQVWVTTPANFRSAPMTVLRGTEDPVAVGDEGPNQGVATRDRSVQA